MATGPPDMDIWKAVMRMLGTDARCASEGEREATDRMLSEVEAKVNRLHRTLDEAPRNLDEAMYEMTRRGG